MTIIYNGILASMKQKAWWEKNSPDEMYKNDYFIALFMHSFSWAFMVMLPTILTGNFILWIFILNIGIHLIVDHSKANLKKINLIQDQSIHIVQIIITWIICIIF